MTRKHATPARVLVAMIWMLALGSILTAYAAERSFISISDIHFNPFYDEALIDTLMASPYEAWDRIFYDLGSRAISRYGQETNYPLLTTLIREMHSVSRYPDFILFTGDFLAHDFNDLYRHYTGDGTHYGVYLFIYKTIGFVSSIISSQFPNIPIYFTLGNNDAYTGDYNSVWDGEFSHTTACLLFEHCIKHPTNRKAFFATYPISGSYSVTMPWNSRHRLISINTNFLSSRHQDTSADEGQKLLSWIEDQLSTAVSENEKTWLVLHIPTGINVYSTMRTAVPGKPIRSAVLQWNQDSNSRFISIIEENRRAVNACFSGHTHMDDFRLFRSSADVADSAYAFIHITPSISPIFGNNPAFQVFTFDDESFRPSDYTTYHLDLSGPSAGWQLEYTFSAVYEQDAVDARSLYAVFRNIQEDAGIRDDYIHYYYSGSTQHSIRNQWLGYWSGIGNLTKQNFIELYNKYVE